MATSQFSQDRVMVRGPDLPLEGGKIAFQSSTEATRTAQNIKVGQAVKRLRAQISGSDYINGFTKISNTDASNTDFKKIMIAYSDDPAGEGVQKTYVCRAAAQVKTASVNGLVDNDFVPVKVPAIGDIINVLFKGGHAAVNYGDNVQFNDTAADFGYFEVGTNDIGLQAVYDVPTSTTDFLVPCQRVN